MQQSLLSFVHPPSLAAEDFVVSGCNRMAHDLVLSWPRWPGFAVHVHGPSGSGKTHLAHIWVERAGAEIVTPEQLPSPGNLKPAARFAIELSGEALPDETAFLHFFNRLREVQGWLLLTSRTPLAQMPISLPDLSSRLSAVTAAALHNPDDTVLFALLRKLFADRQLRVPEEVLHYLLTRTERSWHAAARMVEAIDRISMERKRPITLALIRQMLS